LLYLPVNVENKSGHFALAIRLEIDLYVLSLREEVLAALRVECVRPRFVVSLEDKVIAFAGNGSLLLIRQLYRPA